jgi:hypothetical protein
LTSRGFGGLVNFTLGDRKLETVGLFGRLSFGKSDSEVLNSPLESQGVKSLFQGLKDILESLGTDVVNLIKSLYSVLDDLSN